MIVRVKKEKNKGRAGSGGEKKKEIEEGKEKRGKKK